MNTLNICQGYGATNVTYDVGLLPSYVDSPIAACDFPSRAGVSQRIERLARSESLSLHPPTTPSRRDVKVMLVRRARSVTCLVPIPPSQLACPHSASGRITLQGFHPHPHSYYVHACCIQYVHHHSELPGSHRCD